MDIVKLILDYLLGPGMDKLNFLGESEAKTRTAAQAAVPGLLAAFANLASSSDGATKLVSTLKQMDPSVAENPGKVFTEHADAVTEQGGSILGSLINSNTLSVIIAALSKYAGINSGNSKSLLSYLTPLILGYLAKQFIGKSITTQGLTDLFAGQKANITNALPSGLSLPDLHGLLPTSHGTSRPTTSPHHGQPEPAKSAFPWWVLPLALLGLVGGLFLLWNLTRSTVATPTAVGVPDVAKVTKDLTGDFTTLTDTLTHIKDPQAAEAALPKLAELAGKLEGMKALLDKLPAAGKTTVVELIKSSMTKLGDQLSRVLMIPGVTDKLRPALESITGKAAALAGLPAGQFALPSKEVTDLGSDLSSLVTSLTGSLTGIKDAATAEAALPELSKINLKLDTAKNGWDKMPEAGRATIGAVLKTALTSLRALVEKVIALAGVGDKIGGVVKEIMAKLPAS